MKRGFLLTGSGNGAEIANSAEQPVSNVAKVSNSAERPGPNAAQPCQVFRSIADVDGWLRANMAMLSSSGEAARIKDAVDTLKAKPKPRAEDVRKLFKLWEVQQKIKKDHRPLPELVEELCVKVLKAANELRADLPSVTPSAEQPGASSAAPAAPQEPPACFDFDLATSQQVRLCLWMSGAEEKEKKSLKSDSAGAFGLLQDCRKYRDSNWIVGEDDEKLKKIIRQLEILAKPSCTSQMCRELYKLTEVGQILGTFLQRDAQGHQREQDHEFVRQCAFNCTVPDLVSLFQRRDAFPEDAYPYMAQLAPLGVKVRRKTYEERVLEIYKDLPKTEDLPLLPDYAERELSYRFAAQTRDKAAGIETKLIDITAEFLEAFGTLSLEEEEDTEWREWQDECRRKDQFLDECRRKWQEQGKTEEECRRMWPQALADWRAERKAADLDTMQM